MSHATSQLLEQALRLSDQERGDLAARLIDRLDSVPDDDDVDTAWADEIRARLDDLDHGRVRPVSWAEARRLIAEEDQNRP
jgi:putative addiction module component (TIGR02574 family)